LSGAISAVSLICSPSSFSPMLVGPSPAGPLRHKSDEASIFLFEWGGLPHCARRGGRLVGISMTAPPTEDESLAPLSPMMQFTPQARALGLSLTRTEGAKVWGKVPYRADLVGDPDT